MGDQTSQMFTDALLRGADSLDILLPSALLQGLTSHYSLVCRWAKRINLTTVLDPERAAVRHALDSLLFAELFAADAVDEVVDVGSGAGFPGIVLALARPQLRIRLLEPTRKRASFLRVALAELGRADVAVTERRLEPVASAPWQADALVSRATLPPLQMISTGAAYLVPGGRLILTAGVGAPEVSALSAAAAPVGLTHVERHQWRLPDGHTRLLDVLRRPAVDHLRPGD